MAAYFDCLIHATHTARLINSIAIQHRSTVYMEAPIDLNRFILTMPETAYAQVMAACNGLTDRQTDRQTIFCPNHIT